METSVVVVRLFEYFIFIIVLWIIVKMREWEREKKQNWYLQKY